VGEYVIRPLGAKTWDAFAGLAERHKGVWGGCWCTWFHERSDLRSCEGPHGRHQAMSHRTCAEKGQTVEGNRALKERLVNEGRAHAALVYDADVAVAWCEYGSPEELPNIYHRKEYEAGLGELPDYRITCLFVDRNYRRKGVAAAALRGALGLIAQAGGGVVEAYPHETPSKKVSASFLYNGTRSLFEQAGFIYDRPKGMKNCVMSKTVLPGEQAAFGVTTATEVV
jgi:GNAT superfamily N-acetyltransferase